MYGELESMNIETINKKIDKLNQKKVELIKTISTNKIYIETLKLQINQLETTKTIKGAEVRLVIKNLNKMKTELRSRKNHLGYNEGDLNDIPYKIKRYERLKRKIGINIFDFIQNKIPKEI